MAPADIGRNTIQTKDTFGNLVACDRFTVLSVNFPQDSIFQPDPKGFWKLTHFQSRDNGNGNGKGRTSPGGATGLTALHKMSPFHDVQDSGNPANLRQQKQHSFYTNTNTAFRVSFVHFPRPRSSFWTPVERNGETLQIFGTKAVMLCQGSGLAGLAAGPPASSFQVTVMYQLIQANQSLECLAISGENWNEEARDNEYLLPHMHYLRHGTSHPVPLDFSCLAISLHRQFNTASNTAPTPTPTPLVGAWGWRPKKEDNRQKKRVEKKRKQSSCRRAG